MNTALNWNIDCILFWKYLFIIDNTVFLLICFDSGELDHEVHEVWVAFLILKNYMRDKMFKQNTTVVHIYKLTHSCLSRQHIYHIISVLWRASPHWSILSLWRSAGPASQPSPCGPVDGPSSAEDRQRKSDGRKKRSEKHTEIVLQQNQTPYGFRCAPKPIRPIKHLWSYTPRPVHSSVSVGVGNKRKHTLARE